MSGSERCLEARGLPSGVTATLSLDGIFSSERLEMWPLPKIPPDTEHEIDIFTAASLNSENFNIYLRRGKNVVNDKNAEGWTPLMYAAYLGHQEVSQLLLASGANPSIANREGQTPLMLAASCGSVDVESKGYISDVYGRTSLHYAIKYNQAKITEVLLQGAADPNLADLEGNTPTLLAIKVGNEATVAMLLTTKYGGDSERQNKKGESGMTMAQEHPKVLMLLKDKMGNKKLAGIGEGQPIVELFATLGLDKYAPLFIAKGVFTLSALSKLSEKDIEAMGVTLFGPKKKIMNLIREHREKHAHATTNAISSEGSPRPRFDSRSPTQHLQPSNGESMKIEERNQHRLAEIYHAQKQLLLKQKELNKRLGSALEASNKVIGGGRTVLLGDLQAIAKSLQLLVVEVEQMNTCIDDVLLDAAERPP